MDSATLDYELRSDGVTYVLDEVKIRVQKVSKSRVRVSMSKGNTIIPPETGDLGTGTFRDRLVKLARDRFGDVEGLASDLDLIAVGFEDHLSEREDATTHDDEETNDPALVGSPYRIKGGGFVRLKNTQAGEIPQRLTNFTAQIISEYVLDDGAETRRIYRIAGETANKKLPEIEVPASQFVAMNWLAENWGLSARISAGQGARDYTREAIELLSYGVEASMLFGHTGWREVGDEWMYLHAGGGIGRVGRVSSMGVELSGNLNKRELPEPGTDVKVAVDASLYLLNLAPEEITFPLLSATYRAPLGDSDFSVHLSGPTGEGKSELAAICQQHFGPELDARNLLSWESTENAIEGQGFALKDQILPIDDFAPSGTSYDVQRWHKKADRVMRAKGNNSGRQRMRSDTTLRPEKPPRALMLSTGEDVPNGQSLRARMLIVEMSPGSMRWSRLTEVQEAARSGLQAQAMSAYVQWLAGQYGEIRDGLKREHSELRKLASKSEMHKRTPGIIADLALGLRYFLRFASDVGALQEDEAAAIWERGWKCLGVAARAQAQHQIASEPTQRFRELLFASLASGRAHIASTDGEEPESPEAWGWRAQTVGSGDFEREEWRPQGERLGWIEGDDLYLESEAAYACVQRQGRDSGEPLGVTKRTLSKRLHERGLLASIDETRQTLKIRKTLEGRRRDVLHTNSALSLPTEKPDQPDHVQQEPHTYGEYAPNLWSGSAEKTRPQPDHSGREPDQNPTTSEEPDHVPDHEKARTYGTNEANGRVGQVRNKGEGSQVNEACIHGIPSGIGCYSCDPCHPLSLKESGADPTEGQKDEIRRLVRSGMSKKSAYTEVLGLEGK